jgi:hypothetical protein
VRCLLMCRCPPGSIIIRDWPAGVSTFVSAGLELCSPSTRLRASSSSTTLLTAAKSASTMEGRATQTRSHPGLM